MLRCDNGPELACAAMADWAGERVGLAFIPPDEPWRNGYAESLNSRIRDECLNINFFWSLAQARIVISDWKEESTTADDTARSATTPQRSTLPLAPTDERLSPRGGSVLGLRPVSMGRACGASDPVPDSCCPLLWNGGRAQPVQTRDERPFAQTSAHAHPHMPEIGPRIELRTPKGSRPVGVVFDVAFGQGVPVQL